MSSPDDRDPVPGDHDADDRAAGDDPDRPRPSPGARAASRARRIGGGTRSVPGPDRPAAEPPRDSEPARSSDTDTDTDTDTTVAPDAPGWLVFRRRPGPSAASRPRWLRWLPAGVAAAAVAALAVLCVVFSHGVWWGTPSLTHTREQVLAAAKSCFATMNTYDYRKLDANEAAGAKCATDAMAAQYRKAFDTQIKPKAAKAKFTQTAQVNAAGIESVSRDGEQWVLLMFGQLQITNSSTQPGTPRLDILMAEVTVDKVGDRWLISAYNYA